jgi:hypothetical protein
MRIEVQLSLRVAENLRRPRPKSRRREKARGLGVEAAPDPTSELLQKTKTLGIRLEPTHPGQVHPILAPFYYVEVPDRQIAEHVIEQLRSLDAVEGAYIDPGIDLPGIV